MPTDRELDQLIDAALPSYSAKEPLPGLEHRILAGVLTRPARVGRFSWPLAIGALVCACLLIFLILPKHRSDSRDFSPATASSAAEKGNSSTLEAHSERAANLTIPARRRASGSQSVSAPRTEPLPKQDIFPSSSPLTAEEERLTAYSRAQLRATTPIPDKTLQIEPIRIAELQIKPLDFSALEPPAFKPPEFRQNDPQP